MNLSQTRCNWISSLMVVNAFIMLAICHTYAEINKSVLSCNSQLYFSFVDGLKTSGFLPNGAKEFFEAQKTVCLPKRVVSCSVENEYRKLLKLLESTCWARGMPPNCIFISLKYANQPNTNTMVQIRLRVDKILEELMKIPYYFAALNYHPYNIFSKQDARTIQHKELQIVTKFKIERHIKLLFNSLFKSIFYQAFFNCFIYENKKVFRECCCNFSTYVRQALEYIFLHFTPCIEYFESKYYTNESFMYIFGLTGEIFNKLKKSRDWNGKIDSELIGRVVVLFCSTVKSCLNTKLKLDMRASEIWTPAFLSSKPYVWRTMYHIMNYKSINKRPIQQYLLNELESKHCYSLEPFKKQYNEVISLLIWTVISQSLLITKRVINERETNTIFNRILNNETKWKDVVNFYYFLVRNTELNVENIRKYSAMIFGQDWHKQADLFGTRETVVLSDQKVIMKLYVWCMLAFAACRKYNFQNICAIITEYAKYKLYNLKSVKKTFYNIFLMSSPKTLNYYLVFDDKLQLFLRQLKLLNEHKIEKAKMVFCLEEWTDSKSMNEITNIISKTVTDFQKLRLSHRNKYEKYLDKSKHASCFKYFWR